jgi:hypothetical protein
MILATPREPVKGMAELGGRSFFFPGICLPGLQLRHHNQEKEVKGASNEQVEGENG